MSRGVRAQCRVTGGSADHGNVIQLSVRRHTKSGSTTDRDFAIRRSAAYALGEMGPEARASATALARALKDADSGVRHDAAQSLSIIGPDAKAAVPALAQAIGDDDIEVRKKAIYALGEMGPSAKDAH